MKVKELIEKLQTLEKEHPDSEMVVEADNDDGLLYEVLYVEKRPIEFGEFVLSIGIDTEMTF